MRLQIAKFNFVNVYFLSRFICWGLRYTLIYWVSQVSSLIELSAQKSRHDGQAVIKIDLILFSTWCTISFYPFDYNIKGPIMLSAISRIFRRWVVSLFIIHFDLSWPNFTENAASYQRLSIFDSELPRNYIPYFWYHLSITHLVFCLTDAQWKPLATKAAKGSFKVRQQDVNAIFKDAVVCYCVREELRNMMPLSHSFISSAKAILLR